MTIKELIAELSKYPPDTEIVSIEVDDWQWYVTQNAYMVKAERLSSSESKDGTMLILE